MAKTLKIQLAEDLMKLISERGLRVELLPYYELSSEGNNEVAGYSYWIKSGNESVEVDDLLADLV